MFIKIFFYDENNDRFIKVVVTEEDRQRLQQSLKEMLESICDSAHEQCGRLLSSRTKDGALLERVSSQEFVALAQLIERFVDDCQKISGHRALGLRLAFQAKNLISVPILFGVKL